MSGLTRSIGAVYSNPATGASSYFPKNVIVPPGYVWTNPIVNQSAPAATITQPATPNNVVTPTIVLSTGGAYRDTVVGNNIYVPAGVPIPPTYTAIPSVPRAAEIAEMAAAAGISQGGYYVNTTTGHVAPIPPGATIPSTYVPVAENVGIADVKEEQVE